ncbi:MAG: HTH domain-containing protein [Lachnospiraceae bacterium]|nr:HTH domain-containing protein [Lachnospiraceae bacterium]
MKEKHQKLLKRLDRPEFQTGETLADFMAVSSKTIRLMIREINEELEGAAIISAGAG